MKKIKVTIEPNGSFTADPVEGFSGTTCTHEVRQFVSAVGATITETKTKPEYYDPETPESIFVNQ